MNFSKFYRRRNKRSKGPKSRRSSRSIEKVTALLSKVSLKTIVKSRILVKNPLSLNNNKVVADYVASWEKRWDKEKNGLKEKIENLKQSSMPSLTLGLRTSMSSLTL
jgi:hypothetical protein